MQKIKNYINDALVEPVSGQYLDNYDPAIGEVYSYCPDSDEKDIELAVDAAEKAFSAWSVMPKENRSRILIRISELIDENLEKLAVAESIDNGKPVSLAREVDIPRAASNFYYFATAVMQFSSESHAMENAAI
ncbi:aldehyde dehydrogenase family protein, partial [bacterium]|nr:aldehyde dehydrogenase family protein [bacterium]